MDYKEWIIRERKIRATLLSNSIEILNKSICRVCEDCDEICLCHETNCPNCGSPRVYSKQVQNLDEVVKNGNRIRCRFRYERINWNMETLEK
jgi:hypothetical protein